MESYKALYVKRQQATFRIRLETILFMEKRSRIIIIHLTNGEDIRCYGKYDSLMPMLDHRFVHPHESYVINMQHINRLGNQEVVMMGGQRIKMGGRCFGRLKRAYDAFVKDHIRSRFDV